jgi:cytochrome c peroxidase
MNVLSTLANPTSGELAQGVAQALGEPAAEPAAAVDDRFSPDQWDMIRAMTQPGAPPPDPSNAKADDPGAAALGKKLFFDPALSPSGKVSCSSCHDPNKELQDGLPQSTGGVSPVDRNAPPIALASHTPWQFWDGRADSLWMQALGPPENGKEFGSSRLFVDHVLYDKYKPDYEAVWGAMPNLADTTRFPKAGSPGSPEWATVAPADEQAATRAYVNLGKSIAAFERTLRVQANAFDRYVQGDRAALTAAEKDGLLAFFTAGCAQCHYGPRFTDDAFHAVRFPTGRADQTGDRGRIDGIPLLLQAEANSQSAWSDAPKPDRIARLVPEPSTLGAFKTPTLRGVPGSAPYGHGGTLATLDDVLKNHAEGGLAPESELAAGTTEPWLAPFDDQTRAKITVFLATLTATPVIP